MRQNIKMGLEKRRNSRRKREHKKKRKLLKFWPCNQNNCRDQLSHQSVFWHWRTSWQQAKWWEKRMFTSMRIICNKYSQHAQYFANQQSLFGKQTSLRASFVLRVKCVGYFLKHVPKCMQEGCNIRSVWTSSLISNPVCTLGCLCESLCYWVGVWSAAAC